MPRRQPRTDISTVVSDKLCHSCGACFAVCGHDSIRFGEDAAGHLFPQIDANTCTHCGLCYDVCPGIHFGRTLADKLPDDPFAGHIETCHTGVATDGEIFSNSQSGGIATALLWHQLETGAITGAIVTVMDEGTPPRPRPVIARTKADLLATQKSKYAPVSLLTLIPEIKKEKGPLAIVGLSCHLHGLTNLIDRFPGLDRKIPIRIGLICDKTLTAAAIDFLGQKATNQAMRSIIFRDKLTPSYPGNTVITTDKNCRIVLDPSLRKKLKTVFTPARCRLCFDKMNVYADITVGDPHGLPGIDRTGGESLVIARTALGAETIKNAQSAGVLTLKPADASRSLRGQQIEQKRTLLKSASQAWLTLGKPLPQSYEKVAPFAGDVSRLKEQRSLLLRIDQLSRLQDRQTVLKEADRILLLDRMTELAFRPLKPLRKLWHSLRKRIQRKQR